MIRRAFAALPGPLPVRVVVALVVLVVLAVVLHFVYMWMGTQFLDTGGAVG